MSARVVSLRVLKKYGNFPLRAHACDAKSERADKCSTMLWACDFVRDWPFKTESIVVRFFSLICSDLEDFALKL